MTPRSPVRDRGSPTGLRGAGLGDLAGHLASAGAVRETGDPCRTMPCRREPDRSASPAGSRGRPGVVAGVGRRRPAASPSSSGSVSGRSGSARPTASASSCGGRSGSTSARTWTPATETIVVGPAAAAGPHGDARRGRAGRGRRDVPGAASGTRWPIRTCWARRPARRSGRPSRSCCPIHIVVVEFGLLHGLAFAGALLTAFVVVRLGGGGSGGLTRLLLTGYAVGSILAALLTMAMYMSGQNLREIFSYLLGGLAGSSWIRLAVATPIVLAACVVIGSRARSSTGCSSATRPPATSASMSARNAASCWRWRRWPRRRRSRSAG